MLKDEDEDEDEWTVAKAAGTCVSLFAQCVEDDIVPCVLPFVQNFVRSGNWREREASVMAFGACFSVLNENLTDYFCVYFLWFPPFFSIIRSNIY